MSEAQPNFETLSPVTEVGPAELRRVKTGTFSIEKRNLPPREKERRQKILDTVKKTKEIDAKFALLEKPSNESLAHKIDTLESLECLESGKEDLNKRKDVLDANDKEMPHPVSIRVYTSGETQVTAYVKRASREGFQEYEIKGRIVGKMQIWDEEKKEMTIKDMVIFYPPPDAILGPADKLAFSKKLQERINMIREAGAHYGVTEEEVPLDKLKFLSRPGVEAGETLEREWAVSRLSLLTGLNNAPITVLDSDFDVIKNKDGTIVEETEDVIDLISIQKAVPGEKLSPRVFQELLKKGKDHPGANSFMKLACLDFLVKTHDRNDGNIFYNEKTQEFSGIDNGLSLGLSRKIDGKVKPIDPYLSLPLHVVQQHPEWKLDSETQESLKALAKELLEESKAILDEDEEATRGEQKYTKIQFILDIFRTIFKNKKIAKIEALDFIKRLQYLADNGRPPNLGNDLSVHPKWLKELHEPAIAA